MTKLSRKESFIWWISRIDRFIFTLVDWIVVALALAISIAVVATVFARYVLNNSFSWGEELPGLLLMCLTFFGAAWLARYNGHLAFDGLLSLLPRRLRQIVQTINLLLVQFFLVALTYYGWVITITTGQTSLITLDLPQALFRAVIPVCGLIMILAFSRELVMVWHSPTPPGSAPNHDDYEGTSA
ncbi:TRAP transporter small permease [cf. Phormidesmis sp. LEGE 11477]|uniref:TRAP transporter small permease n=1 Tax=cf. Phormidesmis sp. LEGE 11477 TaxID=1828680 RepID=UPI00187F5FCD|nr:TRAP transporter small permease [cf. Phormidesmis sp. LEGE 11477]MBE9061053.1 TRAP transporter small permease [cf. Phormidesmis sp. LEGE 11477]